MTCSEARTALYPAPSVAAARIDMADASRHVTACEECQSYFRNQEHFISDLRAACPSAPASDALKQRVGAEIEKHWKEQSARGRFQSRRRAVLLLSAGLALASGVFAWFLPRIPSKQFFDELCADHSKYLGAQSQISTNRPAAIEDWFRDKAGFRVQVPSSTEAQLLGARLCFLKKHRAALIFFRKEGHPVSLFEVNASEVSLRALHRSVIDARDFWHDSINGYSLVAIRRQGVVSILVSDLSESDLLGMAAAVRSASL